MGVTEKASPNALAGSEGENKPAESWFYEVDNYTGLSEHDDVLDERSVQLEKMMSEPLSDELVQDVDLVISRHLDEQYENPELKQASRLDEILARYNPEEGEKHPVNDFVTELRSEAGGGKMTMDKVLADLKNMEGPERRQRIHEVRAVAYAMNETIGDKPLADLSDEEKKTRRAAEEMQLRTDIIGVDIYVKSEQLPVERRRKVAEDYVDLFEDYALSDDIRSRLKADLEFSQNKLKGFLKETEVDELEKDTVLEDAGDTVNLSAGDTVVVGRERRGDVASPEAASVDTVYAGGGPTVVERAKSEPKSELKSREAVFGREGISREDVKSISEQVRGLLDEDSAESAFAAAQQLARLRRAGMGVSKSQQEAVFTTLLKHREAIGEADPVEQARYLTYLKYLGAIDEVSSEEKQRIELEIRDRVANKQLKGLDQLCVNAKYLGVREEFMNTGIQAALQKDMQSRLERSGGEEGVTFARARRQYLDMLEDLPDKNLRVEDRVDQRLMDYQERGQWDGYARLKYAVDYLRGGAPVAEAAKEGMVQGVQAARAKAREADDWQSYTAYVADAASLSRRSGEAVEEPKVRRAVDSDTVQFLAGLERVERVSKEAVAEAKLVAEAQEQVTDTERYPQQTEFGQQFAEHERQTREARGQQGVGDEAVQKAHKEVEGVLLGNKIDTEHIQVLQERAMADPKRERRRLRYIGRMDDELDHRQALKEGGAGNTPLRVLGRLRIRLAVADGLKKLRALSPRWKDQRAAWQEMIDARQDTIDSMRAVAADDQKDEKTRAFFNELADEYERINLDDKQVLDEKDETQRKHTESVEREREEARGKFQAEERAKVRPAEVAEVPRQDDERPRVKKVKKGKKRKKRAKKKKKTAA